MIGLPSYITLFSGLDLKGLSLIYKEGSEAKKRKFPGAVDEVIQTTANRNFYRILYFFRLHLKDWYSPSLVHRLSNTLRFKLLSVRIYDQFSRYDREKEKHGFLRVDFRWRSERDLNSRTVLPVYELSKPTSSAS